MYDTILESEHFQKCLEKEIEPPKESLAGYVYKCEKQSVLKDRARRLKTEGQ